MNLILILITIYLVIGFIYTIYAYSLYVSATPDYERMSWRIELLGIFMLTLAGPLVLLSDIFKRKEY